MSNRLSALNWRAEFKEREKSITGPTFKGLTVPPKRQSAESQEPDTDDVDEGTESEEQEL